MVRTDLVTHIKNLVSSFKVAVEEPSSATTVGMRFTLDLHGADTGLEDVTRIVRDELKTVVVPDRWQKLMELQFDDAQPGKVRFKLALEPPAEMRGAGDRTPVSTPDAIELETETGNVTHTLPLSLDRDTVGSVEVSEILSAAGKPNRALANSKRKANQLLGFKVGNQYLYPTFQFDREHKRIKPMALYANVAMECDLDPWGTLDWWFTEDHLLDGQSPVERLAAGTLSEHDIDRMIAHDRMGMD
ncbi:hypothetical protein ABEU20_001540 [Rhodococcus sp. PAM 2766]|uniref:Antitoxin Xre/MbcA/ParS-like toxin-binding domain-containing protein n=1 Tax=Rhodococcus parequi TaxID=3137122 RepID=A0ABW9FBT0_9NOCA